MAIAKSEKHKEYARYAAHCLNMVKVAKDSGSRAIPREMAAEWPQTRGRCSAPFKTWQMQMQ